MKRIQVIIICMVSAVCFVNVVVAAELTPKEELGKALYFDKFLSSPNNMACADCHGEKTGFTGPNPGINKHQVVYPGAVHTRAGNRKPPTAAYGGDSPIFHYDTNDELFIGGMFWDGRATGEVTGDPLADQAMAPFLNPVEQNLSSEEEVCMIVASSKYAKLYEDVYGESIDCEVTDNDGHLFSYKNFALAIAAFERSEEITSYTSKFDYVMNGEADFTEQEAWGWELFQSEGMCAQCHPAPLFTDFSYDNLGVPKNPNNPFYESNPEGFAWVDPGLGGFLDTLDDSYFSDLGLDKSTAVAKNMGKHKVPTLRNVDKRPGPGFAKAYMHNGVFKSLEAVVEFYDDRDDMIYNGLIIPEVEETMNTDELGDLELSDEEEAALVAFMKTLSDGYNPKKDEHK